jgi:hypothetical protein
VCDVYYLVSNYIPVNLRKYVDEYIVCTCMNAIVLLLFNCIAIDDFVSCRLIFGLHIHVRKSNIANRYIHYHARVVSLLIQLLYYFIV